MPQMNPLLWMNLFLMFSGLMVASFIKIYFSKSKNPVIVNNNINLINNKLNWSW